MPLDTQSSNNTTTEQSSTPASLQKLLYDRFPDVLQSQGSIGSPDPKTVANYITPVKRKPTLSLRDLEDRLLKQTPQLDISPNPQDSLNPDTPFEIQPPLNPRQSLLPNFDTPSNFDTPDQLPQPPIYQPEQSLANPTLNFEQNFQSGGLVNPNTLTQSLTPSPLDLSSIKPPSNPQQSFQSNQPSDFSLLAQPVPPSIPNLPNPSLETAGNVPRQVLEASLNLPNSISPIHPQSLFHPTPATSNLNPIPNPTSTQPTGQPKKPNGIGSIFKSLFNPSTIAGESPSNLEQTAKGVFDS
jgi:hypothetical protein